MTPEQTARSVDLATISATAILRELEVDALLKTIAWQCDIDSLTLSHADTIATLLVDQLRQAIGVYVADGVATPSRHLSVYCVVNLDQYLSNDSDLLNKMARTALRDLAGRLAISSR